MDIRKPQLVKVEAFADFFQSGIPGHIQGGSLEKMRVLQHPQKGDLLTPDFNHRGVEGSDVFTASLNALLCRSTRLHCIVNQ